MRNKLIVITAFLLSLIISSVITFRAMQPEEESKVHLEMREAYNATCRISPNDGSTSTGVLLNTGFILTARHCVDDKYDGIITESERIVKIKFYGDDPRETTARVIVIGKSDFALLEPAENMRSDISFSKAIPYVGSPVSTIGMMDAEPPHITSGYISGFSRTGMPKISCYISFGNSGGGLFDRDKNLVGVVNAIRMKPSHGSAQMMVPRDDEWIWVQGRTSHYDELNCMAFYVPIDVIRNELEAKHLLVMVDGPDVLPMLGHWEIGLITTILQVLAMLVFVVILRKYIFGR